MGDHVELRVAGQRPVALVSKYVKTIRCKKRTYIPDPPYIMEEGNPIKVTLKQTYWIGGRILGVLKYPRFRELAGPLKLDNIVEISREIKTRCLSSAGRLK